MVLIKYFIIWYGGAIELHVPSSIVYYTKK